MQNGGVAKVHHAWNVAWNTRYYAEAIALHSECLPWTALGLLCLLVKAGVLLLVNVLLIGHLYIVYICSRWALLHGFCAGRDRC